MSFCPSKDLHSVYLDNELPEIYKAEYEEHLKICPKCQKELEQIKALHKLFNSDASSITPDSHYLDQSFDRLMVKMSYSKNVAKSSKPKFNPKSIVYVASAAAAAAMFALIVPVAFRTAKTVPAANVSSVAISNAPVANNVSLNSGRSVVISGNIDESVLTSVKYGSNTTPMAQNISTGSNRATPGNVIKEVEVFRPNFNDGQTITIKVTVPGMNAVPVTAEYEVPVPVITGR